MPLGLVDFCLFCLQSWKLNPNLRFHSHYAIIRLVFYFIEFATVLSKESFLVSEHFCLFFKYRPSLGHMENACTMQNLLLEEVYSHVQDSSSIPKLDFMHTLVLNYTFLLIA